MSLLPPLNIDLSGLSSLKSPREQLNTKIELKVTAGALNPFSTPRSATQKIVDDFNTYASNMKKDVDVIQSRLATDIAIAQSKKAAEAPPEALVKADALRTSEGNDGSVRSDAERAGKKAAETAADNKKTEAKNDRLAANSNAQKTAQLQRAHVEHAEKVAEENRQNAVEARGIAV